MRIAYESERKAQRFSLGTTVYVPLRKVPEAYAPAVVTGRCALGVHVAMQHPERDNKLYQICDPADLRLTI